MKCCVTTGRAETTTRKRKKEKNKMSGGAALLFITRRPLIVVVVVLPVGHGGVDYNCTNPGSPAIANNAGQAAKRFLLLLLHISDKFRTLQKGSRASKRPTTGHGLIWSKILFHT